MVQNVREMSVSVNLGGTSQVLNLAGAAVQSAAILGCSYVLIYTSEDCFVRAGTNPATDATADGTDMFLAGGNQYRMAWPPGYDGYKLSFFSPALCTVYLTPGC